MRGCESPGISPLKRGFALPLVLFLLLALTLLAHGTLILSIREVQASRAFQQATQAGEAARWAVSSALTDVEALLSSRRVGLTHTLFEEWDGEVWRGASVRWLGLELFFLEGRGGVRGWGGKKRMGGVGWMMDPLARLRAFRGGVEVGKKMEMEEGKGVMATSFFDLPEGWEVEDCSPYAGRLDSIFRGVPPPPLAPSSQLGGEEGDRVPSLGFLGQKELLERGAEPEVQGPPLEGESGCPGDGDPVFWGAGGSLTLSGERLCGLVVVGGDLVLKGGALLQGMALVGGTLRLEGGAIFQGMGRVGDSVRLGPSARLEASGCAALAALSRVPALRQPLLFPKASHIRFH